MPQRGHPSQEGLWALAGPFMERESDPEADGLLDLSFLTEEEQEAIAEVLKRDAHLRQLEEGRVSKLRASLADPGQLKTLTGDWFQEARSQRHHHVHFGSDLVRASIRRKKGSRGGQAQGSNGEAEAAEKEAEEALEPSLPRDEATQEKLSEAEGPDFPSPYVPLKASEDEEQPQAQEAPGPRGALVYAAEEADPEPEPLFGRGVPLPKAPSLPRLRAVAGGVGGKGAPPSLPVSPDPGDVRDPGEWGGGPGARPFTRPHAQQQLLHVQPQLLHAERQPNEPVRGGGGRRGAGARFRALCAALRGGSRRAARARDPVPGPGNRPSPPVGPLCQKLPPPGQAEQAQNIGEETEPESGLQRDSPVLCPAGRAPGPRAESVGVAPRKPGSQHFPGRSRSASGHVGLGLRAHLAPPAAPGLALSRLPSQPRVAFSVSQVRPRRFRGRRTTPDWGAALLGEGSSGPRASALRIPGYLHPMLSAA
uniref:Synaptotagmin-like protein 1 isoform X1 n=1 Tax=Camelus bactrianus TaxID=9837 RepID=A0A9W3FVA1_CAMBA|nr:synaptotagmin-like protein 1 isoform X1 [Camelus bactrianus]XP_045367352.1 synaptotagmin-like protein 1 isoform X1 [Camelus bactrianus]XP_045367353.1 synaptotagmin-like protein 1 isoform X1 [Camelus bactrianus]